MKIFNYSDCVQDQFYFFVYNGVVYYGLAVKDVLDNGDDQPTHFVVYNMYEGYKDVCDVWDATLIFQM